MSNSKIKHPQLENDKIKPVGEIISFLGGNPVGNIFLDNITTTYADTENKYGFITTTNTGY